MTSYFPAIDLSDSDYELSLIDFETYYTIPNINSSNNKFYYDKSDKKVVIPEVSYELRDIEKYLKCVILHSHPDDAARKTTSRKEIEDKENEYPLVICTNNNMKSVIKCAYRVNFTKSNNIESLLGLFIEPYIRVAIVA